MNSKKKQSLKPKKVGRLSPTFLTFIQPLYYFFLIINTLTAVNINQSQGAPCINKSPQSIICIPFAPPKTHLIFPKTCGSGTKGANPRVSEAIKGVRSDLYFSCITLFLLQPNPNIQLRLDYRHV